MDIHKPFNNKMRKFRPLMIHPNTMAYIPDTEWYSEDAAEKLLERYGTVFVKPNKGRIGIGVMRLRHLERGKYEVHYQDQAEVLNSLDAALSRIHENMNPKKRYLVQQGIDLASVLDRPFDLRVVMHKVDGKWQRSAWCVKISPPKLIVTNHARGGVILTVDQAFKQNKHIFNPEEMKQRLEAVCHTICDVFDLHYSFAIIGLDMAVDKNGQIWFIEANTSPDHTMFSKLGDSRIYKRLRKLDRRIRANSRRLLKEQRQRTETVQTNNEESNAIQTDIDDESINQEND